MEQVRKDKTRAVQDNVHGLIRLTQEEMDVIDHPIFQRLRRIHALGLLYYVWPSATHTRFEHSLGVCHMSQKMLSALMNRSKADASKLYTFKDASDGQAVRFHEMDEETRRRITRLTRITALVHDLGHGPLSHSFDTFAPKTEDIEPLLDDERLDAIRPLGVHLTRGKHGRINHEAASCILFAKIWHDLGGELWIPQAIAIILLGDHDGTDAIPADIRPWLPFVRDIVSSAPVDADRMDYLLRDSQALGVSYGLYDSDRVLKSILCVRLDGHYRLGWRLSGLRAIESFILSRFYMFAQCYVHKTYHVTKLMLSAIQEEASSLDLRLIRTDSLDSFAADYANLGDELFLATLESMASGGTERLVRLTRNLRNRRLWTRLYDFESDETHLTDRLVAKMREFYPNERFVQNRHPLSPVKDLEHGSSLARLNREGKYALTKGRSWIEASSIMRTLSNEDPAHVRLYMETDESGRSLAKRAREYAIAQMCELRETYPKPE